MNKNYILKGIIIGTLLITASGQVMAQRAGVTTSDTSARKKTNSADYVPGRFFNLPKEISTSAVSTVSGEKLQKTPTPNLTNTLYGRLTGLTVSQGSGEPGN